MRRRPTVQHGQPSGGTMTAKSLEDRIKEAGNPVSLLRNSQAGPYVFPVASEFSNWRDEQEAWRKTAILFDQSYHMTDLFVEGPDTVRLLSELGVNRHAIQAADDQALQ